MQIYPDSRKSKVIFPSTAEERFYDACLNTLGDGWQVYYSISLSAMEAGEGMKDNECDFVLYHAKHGVFVVEVKGGRIQFEAEDRRFYSINRHGERFLIKDPFKQVLVFKSRLIKFFKKHKIRVPISHIVCFPKLDVATFPEGVAFEKKVIAGREELKNLEPFLVALATESHPPEYMGFEDAGKQLHELLIGSTFTSRLYIRDYIDAHELRVRDLEYIYDSLVTPIASRDRLGIEGEAGTGKTMIALMLAKHFRDLGSYSVLMLSSNPILNLLLRQEAGPGVVVRTYANIADNFGIDLLKPPKLYTGKYSEWVHVEGPKQLQAAIANSQHRYDVIICDEAQDVQPFWWPPLLDFLKSPTSRLYLFFDRSQGVFGSGGDSRFDPDKTLPIPGPYFPLVNNYRTTREISSFARSFRTGASVLKSHCGRLGYMPEIITYRDASDLLVKLEALCKKLFVEEKVLPFEITLLSARDPGKLPSVLHQVDSLAKHPLHRLAFNRNKKWKETRPPDGHISVSTITSFKGLETKIGILINLSEYNLPLSNPMMASLVYVACTRAKHMLYVCVQEDDAKREAFTKALQEVEGHGALVLGGSDKDFEFSGTVSYYNPLRCGWITVEDAAFGKNSILFFPSDVTKSGLTDQIKVGTKLRFRPALEGYVSIASHLRLAKPNT